ncbi:MAG: RHS repeat-associated core domain-containing protein [Anaerolineae bacterium]
MSSANGKAYTYDAIGNMTARGDDELSWDVENRLISATVGVTTTLFSYDGDGVRVKKVVSGTTTYYVGNWYEKTGNEETKYYYHGGRLVASRKNNTLYYLHLDHLGSTMLTTDGGQDVVAEQRFYPWGEATRYTSGTQKTEFNFTGQRLDGSTDLLYYGARYYDPVLRRWVQPDTVVPDPGNPQALNRYAYVLNNPLRYTHPTGVTRYVSRTQK